MIIIIFTRYGAKKGKPKPKKVLQGNRIEHPDYIQEKGLKLDYDFYISNQIMNPVKQVLDLEKMKMKQKHSFLNLSNLYKYLLVKLNSLIFFSFIL